MGGPQSWGSLTQTLSRPPPTDPPAPLHKPLRPQPPGPSGSVRTPSPELLSPVSKAWVSLLERNLRKHRP